MKLKELSRKDTPTEWYVLYEIVEPEIPNDKFYVSTWIKVEGGIRDGSQYFDHYPSEEEIQAASLEQPFETRPYKLGSGSTKGSALTCAFIALCEFKGWNPQELYNSVYPNSDCKFDVPEEKRFGSYEGVELPKKWKQKHIDLLIEDLTHINNHGLVGAIYDKLKSEKEQAGNKRPAPKQEPHDWLSEWGDTESSISSPSAPAIPAPVFLGEPTEYISIYSRADALDDGVLIDVSKMAKEAGIKIPTAINDDVEAILRDIGNSGEDYEGRLWDTLSVARMEMQRNLNASSFVFSVTFAQKEHQLQCSIGPGDTSDPVITIEEA